MLGPSPNSVLGYVRPFSLWVMAVVQLLIDLQLIVSLLVLIAPPTQIGWAIF